MKFFDACNEVRNRVPYAYWLVYDVVIAILLWWGFTRLSRLFLVGFVFLAVAVFFDITESVVKWRWSHGEFRALDDRRG